MSIDLSKPDHFVSLEALSLLFGVGPDCVYDMMRCEKLPVMTVGRLRKVPVVALARHLENAGMADNGKGRAMIDAAKRQVADASALHVDMRRKPVDRTAAVAERVKQFDSSCALQDANELVAKAGRKS